MIDPEVLDITVKKVDSLKRRRRFRRNSLLLTVIAASLVASGLLLLYSGVGASLNRAAVELLSESSEEMQATVTVLREEIARLNTALLLEAEAGVALQERVTELTTIDPDALKKLRSLLLSPRLLNNRNKTTGATPMFRLFRHSMPTEEYKNYVQRAIDAGGDINQPRFAFDKKDAEWDSGHAGHNILQFLVRDGQAHKALWAVENFGGWDFMYTNYRGTSLLDIVESEIVQARDTESEHYVSLLKLRDILVAKK